MIQWLFGHLLVWSQLADWSLGYLLGWMIDRLICKYALLAELVPWFHVWLPEWSLCFVLGWLIQVDAWLLA